MTAPVSAPYLQLPVAAFQVACTPAKLAGVAVLYREADARHWEPFDCPATWLRREAGLSARAAQELVHGLAQLGLLELEDEGGPRSARRVRLLRPAEVAERNGERRTERRAERKPERRAGVEQQPPAVVSGEDVRSAGTQPGTLGGTPDGTQAGTKAAATASSSRSQLPSPPYSPPPSRGGTEPEALVDSPAAPSAGLAESVPPDVGGGSAGDRSGPNSGAAPSAALAGPEGAVVAPWLPRASRLEGWISQADFQQAVVAAIEQVTATSVDPAACTAEARAVQRLWSHLGGRAVSPGDLVRDVGAVAVYARLAAAAHQEQGVKLPRTWYLLRDDTSNVAAICRPDEFSSRAAHARGQLATAGWVWSGTSWTSPEDQVDEADLDQRVVELDEAVDVARRAHLAQLGERAVQRLGLRALPAVQRAIEDLAESLTYTDAALDLGRILAQARAAMEAA